MKKDIWRTVKNNKKKKWKSKDMEEQKTWRNIKGMFRIGDQGNETRKLFVLNGQALTIFKVHTKPLTAICSKAETKTLTCPQRARLAWRFCAL